jgi:hypothetical protein
MGNTYKDSLFRSLFNDEAAALELYNSIKGTHYDLHTSDIEINTLPETFFTHEKNDVSFLLDKKLIIICEHQSTINENMPLRFLPYISRLFENCIPDKTMVYQHKRILLPAPEFIVLYNGVRPYADKSWMKLSDAYLMKPGKARLELLVRVYNINAGHNADVVKKSTTLSGYVVFVELVRGFKEEEQAAHPELSTKEWNEGALRRAISYCKEQGILGHFWGTISMEEELMIASEWNMEDALAVRYREGREEGREEGIDIGEGKGIKLVLSLLEQGYTVEEVRHQLGNLEAGT